MYKKTMSAADEQLRYPVGRFVAGTDGDLAARRAAIADLAALPARMRDAIAGLTDAQLDTPYRPAGWTVRQVVHHVADSHMNGFIRVKLALTEQSPTIKPYDQDAFVQLADMRLPVAVSLGLLDGIHARWVATYGGMTDDQFARTFVHPEYPAPLTLDWQARHYAWHSRHHVGHITSLRQRQGW